MGLRQIECQVIRLRPLDRFVRFDKKNLSGSLQMILLKGIGKPVIRTEKDISPAAVKTVLKKLLRKWA